MNTLSRQDDLLRLLRRRGSTTIDYLAESLGISRRTALRDIAKLREQGFTIQTSSGPGGGVYLDPSSVLVTAKLTSAEAFALLISIAVLKETHALPFAHLADAGLKKIEQSLPRDRILELREVLTSVYIGSPTVDMPRASELIIEDSVLPIFEACFINKQSMQFCYTDRNGKKTEREANPHAILVLSPCWYLVGYDPKKEAFRHFRMDRISAASALDQHFRRRAFTIEEGKCPFKAFSFK